MFCSLLLCARPEKLLPSTVGLGIWNSASFQTRSSAVAERPLHNNNNNNQDNVYGAVIMAEPLREFTRFI